MRKGEKKSYNLISEVISETIDNYAELQKKYKELEKEYHQVLDDYLNEVNERLTLEEELRAYEHSEEIKEASINMANEVRKENVSE